jgi:hypothetical protein
MMGCPMRFTLRLVATISSTKQQRVVLRRQSGWRTTREIKSIHSWSEEAKPSLTVWGGARVKCIRVIVLIAILSLLAYISQAQAGDGLRIAWWTVDDGGARLSGGAYTLYGSVGQPDVGTLSRSDYTLVGGFWARGEAKLDGKHDAYIPLVLRRAIGTVAEP